jgi:cytosine/adenosine deaminase-related metal-dependent hydrolase
VSQPPIDDGAVYFSDGLIRDVGSWADVARRWAGEPAEDLGEVVLMPGLINAHCHLDYTGMAGMIPAPSSSANFPDWIKSILSLKAHWSYTEFAASWVKGAKQLLETGCTTVLDIEAVPELLPEAWEATALRIVSFLEMTGVKSGDSPEKILAGAEGHVQRLRETKLHSVAISPHALYSTPPKLLEVVAAKMREENVRVCMHLAESHAEFEMYQNASGAMFDWLKTQRKMDDCGGRSPVQQAQRLGLLNANLLAVHCNYLAPGDAKLLGKSGVTVVHCPRSHAYFDHAAFGYEELVGAGVNVVLGTDSLASVRSRTKRTATLNMWEEMRMFAKEHGSVPAENIVKMATVNAAKFVKDRAGSLGEGKIADMIAVGIKTAPRNIAEGLLGGAVSVVDRWVGGKRVVN